MYVDSAQLVTLINCMLTIHSHFDGGMATKKDIPIKIAGLVPAILISYRCGYLLFNHYFFTITLLSVDFTFTKYMPFASDCVCIILVSLIAD